MLILNERVRRDKLTEALNRAHVICVDDMAYQAVRYALGVRARRMYGRGAGVLMQRDGVYMGGDGYVKSWSYNVTYTRPGGGVAGVDAVSISRQTVYGVIAVLAGMGSGPFSYDELWAAVCAAVYGEGVTV
jgi:hypothetical protein